MNTPTFAGLSRTTFSRSDYGESDEEAEVPCPRAQVRRRSLSDTDLLKRIPKPQRTTSSMEMLEMGIDPQGNLKELGYEFRGGQLRQVGSESGFEYQGQQHYDKLAEAVVEYVPLLLEDQGRLEHLWLPLGAGPGNGVPIYVSEGYEQAEKLLVIVQGSGRVRAGVWGCALCINVGLDHGTMLPFIEAAHDLDYGIVVLNPNENSCDGKLVRQVETPTNHVAYFFEKVLLQKCKAASVDVIAHSHGGRAFVGALSRAGVASFPDAKEAASRLRRIVFTDSYHVQSQLSALPKFIKGLLADPSRAVNYVPHLAPVGTPVEEWATQEYHMTSASKGCICLSAGTEDHAATNACSMEKAFEFLQAPEPGDEVDGDDSSASPPPLQRNSRYNRTTVLPIDLAAAVMDACSEEPSTPGMPVMVTKL